MLKIMDAKDNVHELPSYNWKKPLKRNKAKIKYKNGTVINPPPIPNNPATKPTGIAVKAINKII